MGDVNGLVVTDVLGLAKPVQKLVETVASGIGKVYEPTHIRRMAKAKADEIQIISDSINKNIALPVRYEAGEICINAEDANELARRAQNRALYQEMKKQQNIESVIGKAYDQLANEEVASEKPVDPDWVNEFFDNVANVSNDNMQMIWAKLLAGEVLNPGSFSLRTLATLKNLSQNEATLFSQITPYILGNIMQHNANIVSYFLFSDFDLLNRNHIQYSNILLLSDAGLFNIPGNTMINFHMKPEQSTLIIGSNKSIRIENKSSQEVSLCYSAFPLTEAGTQLLPIASQFCTLKIEHYVDDCLEYLQYRGFGTMHRDPLPQEILAYIE